MRVLLLGVLLFGCGGQKTKEVEVRDGKPCSVTENESGTLISCPDGSNAVVKNGQDGKAGSPGKSGTRGPAGSSGPAGIGCTAQETEQGIEITCADGQPFVIRHGQAGKPGEGIGDPNRRHCRVRYNFDQYWWWELSLLVQDFGQFKAYTFTEVGGQRNPRTEFTRQSSLIADELTMLQAEVFGASVKDDVATFTRLETGRTVSCNLAEQP